MDIWMIFIVGVILGMVIMAIIAAAGNIQWGCRDDDTKSEEQEILDRLKASELGIILHPDDVDIEKVDDTTIYIRRRNRV
jgi:hypothetical protein